VLSESPCVPNRRAARDGKGPILRRPRPTRRGKGGGPQFRAFPSWVSSFSCLRSSYVGVCTGLLFLPVLISQIVVGTPTEGDMARFRLRFRGCLHVPHQNRPTKKIQKSSFMTPFYMQRHNKTKCIYDSLFSPISYGFKAADVLFCLCIFIFLTLINLHAMYVSLVNLFKLPVACFVRPAPL